MKALLATAALFIFTATAQAESVQIKSIANFEFSGSTFRVDAASGMAWIDIDMTREYSPGRSCLLKSDPYMRYPAPNSACPPEFVHLMESTVVPGLKYDAVAAQILFVSKEGRKTVCGTVFTKRRTWRKDINVINFTGSCRIGYARDNAGTTVYLNVN